MLGACRDSAVAIKSVLLNMPKLPANKKTAVPQTLKGWQQISAFLGEPPSVVQRWASDGMPVRKQGRYVETTPEELNAWLGKESGKPVHVATENTDLAEELKRGLSFIRREKTSTKEPPKKAKRRNERR
jgi:hypothetical protein